MKFDIPKEIKSLPQMFGLFMKDFMILIFGGLLILSVLGDYVHSTLKIPFTIISFGALLFLIAPSINNRGKKNYESIFYLFKHNRMNYHSIDVNAIINKSKEGESTHEQ